MIVQIPVGARFVGIPGTESEENPRGIMVEVYWEQDDTGSLCISGHLAEIPVPPNVQAMPPAATSGRNYCFSLNRTSSSNASSSLFLSHSFSLNRTAPLSVSPFFVFLLSLTVTREGLTKCFWEEIMVT
jgi:hypothetical protein